MRDTIIIISIIVFWFLLALGLTNIINDPILSSDLVQGNTTLSIPDNLNQTFSGTVNDTGVGMGLNFQTTGYWNMLIRVITFRVPILNGMPSIIISFLNFINFILVLTFGIMIFRLIWVGGKG